ncbi:MAG: TIGR00730 family Rossman fold protein [Phycisphaerae bacterium]|nr:TIGR00730 family Rossman fold protein [Phycisphaerae bacterium]
MSTIKSVTVFCSSSTRADAVFMDAAREMGTLLGRRGLSLVFGGGSVGLMGTLFEGAQAAGAKTIGITTRQFVELEQAHPDCDELLVMETLAERKKALIDQGDAVIVMPGGLGTYEEFFDAFVGRVLGHHEKPIGLVNVNGALDVLVNLLEDGISNKFISRGVMGYLHHHETPEETLEAIITNPTHVVDPSLMVPSGDWEQDQDSSSKA